MSLARSQKINIPKSNVFIYTSNIQLESKIKRRNGGIKKLSMMLTSFSELSHPLKRRK